MSPLIGDRPRIGGKFLHIGQEKLYVRGVTYGTFRPREDGLEYPAEEVVESDFAAMAANGITAVRTYTVPPRWLLDAAARHGLHIMVGIPVERWVGYLTDRKDAPDLVRWVREQAQSIAGHPAILCYAVGNEIPAQVVRWHGRRRIERFIERLYQAVKAVDPEGLVTYVNYPSTEYLDLSFLDLVCFNVYLERQESLESYLPRLQNLAGDRPLLLTELGLDSIRHGEEVQSATLDRQLRAAFRAGCAGAFVYAWTDEWHAGGQDMLNWAFGLTRRDRGPKPALEGVRKAFAEVPANGNGSLPLISVVVCSYNGARRIRECLDGLARLEYPRYEVIVVDDGSTDETADIAREFPFRVIRTAQRGLSHARNTGMRAAKGEIVAYIDDDASPDPHWLTYLALSFASSDHAAIGGPNIAPQNGSIFSECYGRAPGCPVHVLLSDQVAEHIPGCNMAFRKNRLEAIDGFDQQFRVAGDDVDVCWRLQEKGWTLGFSPAAMVWHHPRTTLRSYWRQQKGYGKAEALLEDKWPEKYNSLGALRWNGRVYTKAASCAGLGSRIYHGVWGSAPFQRLYTAGANGLGGLPLSPDWFFLAAGLALLSAMGFLWKPLFLAAPILLLCMGLSLTQAVTAAIRCSPWVPASPLIRLRLRGLMTLLFLAHPLARLHGRLVGRFIRWRRDSAAGFPLPRRTSIWTGTWEAAGARLEALRSLLRSRGLVVLSGGDFDRWDLEVRGGTLGALRLLMAVEEHGQGHQLVRLRWWPRWSRPALVLFLFGLAVTAAAAADRAWTASALPGLCAAWVGLRGLKECSAAAAQTSRAVREYAAQAENSGSGREGSGV